jgi:hypothetical protein
MIDKELTLLKIKANPNDPILFQMFFCADCGAFVESGQILPPLERQHPGHRLAWLPTVDEPVPGKSIRHINHWLEVTQLSSERRQWLKQVAQTTNTISWAWVVSGVEYEDWLNYLDGYLDELVESWLAALNGFDSPLISAELIWQTIRPARHIYKWAEPGSNY